MANTPHLSSSLFQSPPRNRPELGGFKTEPTPQRAIFYDSSPLWLQSPQRVKSAFRKCSTLEADLKMKRMLPYKHRTSPQSPEVGFAMRLGRASHSSPTFNDVVKLSNELFNKYYIAKLASRDCIVSRISVTLREIDALEKMKDFLVESQKQEKEQLAAASEELELFVKEAKARNSSVMCDIASRHALYADECAALTAADKQLSQLLALSNYDSILGDSDTDTRDDVVYKDDEDERTCYLYIICDCLDFDGVIDRHKRLKVSSPLFQQRCPCDRPEDTEIFLHVFRQAKSSVDPSFLDEHHSYGVLSVYNPQQVDNSQTTAMTFMFRDPVLPSYYMFPDPILPSHYPQASPFVTYPQSTNLPFPPALTTSGGSQSTPPATHPHYPSQLAQPDLDPFLSSSQSTSQVRMEHLPTTGTSHTLYTNPLVLICASEITTDSFRQTNVITGVTTRPAVRQCRMRMPSPPPPPATSSAPARAASFTKEQMKALHAMTKNNICRYMFNEEAVPHTRPARDLALRDAVSMASNTLFGCDPPPVVKLRPCDEDEAETRHPNVRTRLARNDYDVFHLKEAGTTKYFQHDSIRHSIAYVVWRELQCPEVLNADTMAPLITLTSTCLLVALESRVSKVHNRTLGTAEHFTHTYQEIRSFIDTVVLANETNHQSFVVFCSLIISRTKAWDLDVSYVDDDF
ncbi:hypothetical protein EDD16DRAFT_1525611 [Pisolithus croceorrhizus]|nr:hypothetical protein EDD16DRAFT_1525611 [Pisolithus croceorrhizus]KAI6126013.1 hypothetical protein EV401DRAFT_1885800 [Pisolithus croceorrhizus]KAI6169806.1 hypothetical protein EDD17DRAFT_1502726 [Pisolithus thermaeus]